MTTAITTTPAATAERPATPNIVEINWHFEEAPNRQARPPVTISGGGHLLDVMLRFLAYAPVDGPPIRIMAGLVKSRRASVSDVALPMIANSPEVVALIEAQDEAAAHAAEIAEHRKALADAEAHLKNLESASAPQTAEARKAEEALRASRLREAEDRELAASGVELTSTHPPVGEAEAARDQAVSSYQGIAVQLQDAHRRIAEHKRALADAQDRHRLLGPIIESRRIAALNAAGATLKPVQVTEREKLKMTERALMREIHARVKDLLTKLVEVKEQYSENLRNFQGDLAMGRLLDQAVEQYRRDKAAQAVEHHPPATTKGGKRKASS